MTKQRHDKNKDMTKQRHDKNKDMKKQRMTKEFNQGQLIDLYISVLHGHDQPDKRIVKKS
jgi:hypothetical protein